jgi:hypothetical protein
MTAAPSSSSRIGESAWQSGRTIGWPNNFDNVVAGWKQKNDTSA